MELQEGQRVWLLWQHYFLLSHGRLVNQRIWQWYRIMRGQEVQVRQALQRREANWMGIVLLWNYRGNQKVEMAVIRLLQLLYHHLARNLASHHLLRTRRQRPLPQPGKLLLHHLHVVMQFYQAIGLQMRVSILPIQLSLVSRPPARWQLHYQLPSHKNRQFHQENTSDSTAVCQEGSLATISKNRFAQGNGDEGIFSFECRMDSTYHSKHVKMKSSFEKGVLNSGPTTQWFTSLTTIWRSIWKPMTEALLRMLWLMRKWNMFLPVDAESKIKDLNQFSRGSLVMIEWGADW